MNSEGYIGVLRDVLLPSMSGISNAPAIFQQDNASIHKSKKTTAWLAAQNFEILPWPALSPDLNPIEDLWGILSMQVYAGHRQFSTVAELGNAILEEWANLDLSLLRTLIDSMPTRITQVITRDGNSTDY